MTNYFAILSQYPEEAHRVWNWLQETSDQVSLYKGAVNAAVRAGDEQAAQSLMAARKRAEDAEMILRDLQDGNRIDVEVIAVVHYLLGDARRLAKGGASFLD